MAPASTESHLGRKLRSALDTVVHKAADAADAAEQQASKADEERKKKGCREVVTSAARSPAGSAVLTATAAYLTIRGGIELFHRARRAFLRQLLLELGPALDSLGQTYWLDFGCLLGIHRGGDLILHDNDIDLAVLNPDWPTLLEGLKARLPAKYSLKVVIPDGAPQSSWIRVYCPLGMADLFGAHDEGADKIFVDCGHGDTMHIDRALVLPPARKPWRGTNLAVPADLEGTLAMRYGPDWRTPAYMSKGADTVEGNKPYAKLFRVFAKLGIRI